MDLQRNRWVGEALGLASGLLGGRLLGAVLGSRAGGRFMERVDGEHLTPLENRVVAEHWAGGLASTLSSALGALVAALPLARREAPPGDHVTRSGEMARRNVDWVQVVQRAGEIMLALGAIFRVLGQFLEEREHVAQESQGRTARRLTQSGS